MNFISREISGITKFFYLEMLIMLNKNFIWTSYSSWQSPSKNNCKRLQYYAESTCVHYANRQQQQFIIKVQLMHMNTIVINIKCIWVAAIDTTAPKTQSKWRRMLANEFDFFYHNNNNVNADCHIQNYILIRSLYCFEKRDMFQFFA